jgi:hypothetical protein
MCCGSAVAAFHAATITIARQSYWHGQDARVARSAMAYYVRRELHDIQSGVAKGHLRFITVGHLLFRMTQIRTWGRSDKFGGKHFYLRGTAAICGEVRLSAANGALIVIMMRSQPSIRAPRWAEAYREYLCWFLFFSCYQWPNRSSVF